MCHARFERQIAVFGVGGRLISWPTLSLLGMHCRSPATKLIPLIDLPVAHLPTLVHMLPRLKLPPPHPFNTHTHTQRTATVNDNRNTLLYSCWGDKLHQQKHSSTEKSTLRNIIFLKYSEVRCFSNSNFNTSTEIELQMYSYLLYLGRGIN